MATASASSEYRLPPHSLDAERAILGTFFLNPDAVADVQSLLEPGSFYDPRHQKLFETILTLSERKDPIDPLVVINELARRGILESVGGADYVTGLEQNVISPGNVMHHARIVQEKAILRRLIGTSAEISEDAYSERDDVQDLLAKSEQKLFEIIKGRKGSAFYSFADVAQEVYADVLHRSENRQEVTGLTTGFKHLDQLLGGLQKSDLLILAARPSMGKTSLALNLAVNAARHGHRDKDGNPPAVALFSLEMSAPQVIQRIVCTEAQIPMDLLRKNMMSHRQVEQFTRVSQEMAEFPIFVNDTPGLDPTDLRLQAQHLQARCPGLAFVVIDYLQLMSIKNSRGDNRQQEVSEISRSLKALARDLDVPVLALSQLSRNIENRRGSEREPRLSDLRESGAIEQDADVVIFIHRERKIEDKSQQMGANRAPTISPVEIVIAKQRNGPVGKVPMLFREDFTQFVEMTPGQG